MRLSRNLLAQHVKVFDVNKRRLIHWSIRGPAAASGNDQASHPAFRCMTTEIGTRVRHLLPVLARATNREIQP
ncbi:hypothetical protein RB199_22720 [Streptomyces libani]|uniref:Uncharacterized protein n=1 Tax=Streptomyces nigrescens TaxID=1920 RepID=A0A640TZP9_STRNI|nr:hypothetical protein DKG71_02135 [Streptomyces sp. NEAU-S7GS2]MCW7986598.1 hypothetical protein [Streptomyces platensis subsp. clarensis]GFE27406.1 hypothetical protein Sliba_78590 [Streptomyces libani subsp. libani]GGV96227.1 hypothetical protein GCM10010500_38480 [Streptomyces libani subsp. libani]SCK47788.1 hypothetical protein YWIDRAFT_07558 [Streptomyces sp. SceaMP-e96]